MLENLLLSIASLISANPGMTFFEAELDIPAGEFELSAEMEWNAVTLFSPDGSALPPMWYHDGENFRPWPIAEEPNEQENQTLLELLLTNPENDTLRIKSNEPVSVVAHFYNTRISGERFVATAGTSDHSETRSSDDNFSPLDDDTFDDPETGLAPYVSKPQYISRHQWGANEDLRVWKPTRRGLLQQWFETEEDLVEPQYRPKVIRAKDQQGRDLRWPIAESPIIKKFVIHHTGEYVENGRDPMEIMRAIYAFHTLTRGWGDIGYNYVIDKQGNIYEGRAGGPRAVGAHVAFHNIGTVGVSLMGNFEYEQPTERQLDVLKVLLAEHANRFNLDPKERSFFLGTNSYNIAGHKDVARQGHATSCPGKNLAELLPRLRREVAFLKDVLYRQEKSQKPMARDFLQQSEDAPQFFKKPERFQRPEKAPLISPAKLITKEIIQRGDRKTLEVKFENGTQDMWPAKISKFLIQNLPEGMSATPFRAVDSIQPGRDGFFRGTIIVDNVPNGIYTLHMYPEFIKDKIFRDQEFPYFELPIQVSGDKIIRSANPIPSTSKKEEEKPDFLKKLSATMFHRSAAKNDQPKVKVKLKFFDQNYAQVDSTQKIILLEDSKQIASIHPSTSVKIVPDADIKKKQRFVRIYSGEESWIANHVTLRTDGILQIKNYSRNLGKLPYNQFRRELHFYPETSEKLLIVNELPIEEYLWGLAEEPGTEPDEKRHAIHVLARSYAYVYSGAKRKFGTSLYDLEDDPATSQFYLGYDWERYHSSQKDLVAETEGRVLTYAGQPVIGPYFTQSEGHSSDKWHKAYPWAKVRPLPFDEGLEQRGHGVGLSGNSARELAKQGKNYEEIIDYFFEGVKTEKIY
ncbi:N-acetylmuramoyl-L-alanine amidase [Candidatus Gracilibacteria bacterium]|nr:N-acetylmuramoyl-L-alanine amidase [Candidatus Gracilibacteria bacterium]MCF7819826.1 N-acetylmuramoyl-L-alanine amidase [Candidatus Gracilibacteria bacterium]